MCIYIYIYIYTNIDIVYRDMRSLPRASGPTAATEAGSRPAAPGKLCDVSINTLLYNHYYPSRNT